MKKLIVTAAILTAAIFASGVLAIDGGSPSIGASANVYCNVDTDCVTGYTCINYACVPKTCGISASPLVFGNVVPGTTIGLAWDKISTIHNGGNTPTTSLDIYGTGWVGTTVSASNTMPVEQTYFWNGASAWQQLTGSWASTGLTANPGDIPVYFALVVPVGQATDTYAQTITFSAGC